MSISLKNNKTLIAGILLPVLMMIIFLLASILPNYFVDAPQYDVLFMISGYTTGAKLEPTVLNNHLQITFTCTQSNCQHGNLTNQKLYLFNVKNRQLKQFSLTAPVIPSNSNNFSTQLQLPSALTQLTLDSNNVSPDGYVLNTNRNNAAFIGGLFYYNDTDSRIVLSKMGKIITIPISLRRYEYASVQFIGWVIPRS